MYYLGYFALILTFLASLAASINGLLLLWRGQRETNLLINKAHWLTSFSLLLASAALLHGLFWQDYSLQYAANYTDKYLPLFYRLTAFWAGQPGSMLFWTLMISLSGTLFTLFSRFKDLYKETRLWFWSLFYIILVFFSLLLSAYSNPFIMQTPAPLDGNGLNPLLQNPGMIIHPPLLFIGYAGFVVPSCLALAQSLAGRPQEIAWYSLTRPFLILGWMFLTAGILLGAWWAYMELGWGGYWAWDPVENSSLIPWHIATACLHSLIIEKTKAKLSRYNTLLIALTTLSTFFATFLVRSGFIDSVHAFGQSSVGWPLAILVIVGLILAFYIALSEPPKGEPLDSIVTREGLLAVMSWFLLALSLIILFATMWPAINKLFSSTPRGLDANFYNQVCLPLACVLLLILSFCPFRESFKPKKQAFILILLFLIFAATCGASYLLGYRHPLAMLAFGSSVTILGGQILTLGLKPNSLKSLGALGTHLGLALCALGVAFSGPYASEHDVYLTQAQSVKIADYELTLEYLGQEKGAGYTALVAQLQVQKDSKDLGLLCPERRIYEKFGDMQFSEVDTIPSLGCELYASLLGLTPQKEVLIRFSVKPLVNWLWIGGFLMSLLPLLALFSSKKSSAG
ncbi:MAG: heme lyase CcmF/NrfE family subunit [Desulfovibrionaceae bacterium]|nr:heme lyase CcmF/NrfE family subunit [Desulfovibrionaceae bacterium]